MQLPPLTEGRLIRRTKRFLADVALETGEVVTAHCPNPGAMLGLLATGNRVWLSRSDNPRRKLAWTWELVEVDGALVGVHTGLPNRLAEEAIRAGRIPELAGYASLRREVRYGASSRIDLLLEDDTRPAAYVEVKNVHMMRRQGLAEFPDSVTARGAKHLRELGDAAQAGHRAVMLYVVQYPGAARFAIAGDIDPAYAAGLEAARLRGVETLCYGCHITTDAIELAYPLTLDFD